MFRGHDNLKDSMCLIACSWGFARFFKYLPRRKLLGKKPPYTTKSPKGEDGGGVLERI